MKARVLAEGSTGHQRLIRHWGLSILVGDSVLFDTFGQPAYVVRQLRRYRAAIGRIRHIVISHDDWDHITGLPELLRRSRGASVYICPGFRPEVKEMIRSCGASVVEMKRPARITGAVYSSGELRGAFRGGVAIPEQYLAIRKRAGSVIITGCAHPGIVRIVRHARKHFGRSVDLVMGGFHLKDNPDEVNTGIVRQLKGLGVRRVMPLHCTGRRAQKLFGKEYGSECVIPAEGEAVEL